MRINIIVSLVAFAAIASTMQSASAQEGQSTRGARFNFAPNVYKTESARLPRGYDAPDPVHNVRHGAVPKGNMLGIDPTLLSKPAPPPPVQTTMIAMPSVAGQALVPKTNANFNPMFGKPMVAQLPAPVPQQAVAMPIMTQPLAAKSAPSAKRPVVARANVNGKLLTPVRRRSVTPAAATPQIASYGNGVGYSPGTYLPTASSGSDVRTAVSGQIIKRHK
jgi:hypothetical protein